MRLISKCPSRFPLEESHSDITAESFDEITAEAYRTQMTGTEITLDGACSGLKAIVVPFSPICDSYSIKSYIHGIFKSYPLAIFDISTTVAKEMGHQTQRC